MMTTGLASATERVRPAQPRSLQRNDQRKRQWIRPKRNRLRSLTQDNRSWSHHHDLRQRVRLLLPSRAEAGSWKQGERSAKPKNAGVSVFGTTQIVGICTVLCKVTGLIREVFLTSLFGIGPIMDAFAFSCVVPAYFQTVLGGVNGPIHTSMLISLKRKKGEKGNRKQLTESLSSWVLIPGALITLVLYTFPFMVIKLFAPGVAASPGGQASLELSIATEQLKMMSPCVLTGALTGIAFGALNAANHFVSPSISPALGNLVMIASLFFMRSFGATSTGGGAVFASASGSSVVEAGRHLAIAFAMGSISQLLLQAWVMHRERVSGFFRLRLRLKDWNYFLDTMKILLPTCISSTMLQLATYTDLWFASSWPGAAAIMACAALLITAPLGLLSNVIIIPRMPQLAQVAAEENWQEVKSVCDKMLRTSLNVGVPLSISLVAFASQAVQLVYERSAFTANSTLQVAPVVVVYALGITCFLGRDIVLRTFYAMGKGSVPAVTSVVALALNAALDYYFGQRLSLSAVGLVLSTVAVTFMSVLVLYGILCRDLRRNNHSLQQREEGKEKGDADGNHAGVPFDDDRAKRIGRFFLSNTVLAASAASIYCKWLLTLMPDIQAFLTWKGLHVNFFANALVVGAHFTSCWLVYYIVFRLSCNILKRSRLL